jgi:hypothetical protein
MRPVAANEPSCRSYHASGKPTAHRFTRAQDGANVRSGCDERGHATAKHIQQVGPDLVDRAVAVDTVDEPTRPIVVEDGGRLIEVDGDAAGDSRALIVAALYQMLAAFRARAIGRKSVQIHVECALAAVTHAATGEPLDETPWRHVEEQDGKDSPAATRKLSVESIGLPDGAWEAVQERAVLGVCILQPLDQDLDDEIVRDKVAPVHVGAGGPPERRSATPVLA